MMLTLLVLLLAQFRGLRVEQALHNPEATVAAVSVAHEGEIFHLKGAVEIRTDTIVLRADEATCNHATGEIEAHGDIKVKPGAVLVTPGPSQFGVK